MVKTESKSPQKRVGVIAVAAADGKLLVIERSQTVAAPGAYCFPGGGMEPCESQAETIIREMREELAAEIEPIAPLWRSVTAWDVQLHWWQVKLADIAVLVPNPAEVASCHWLLPEEIRAQPLLLSSNHAFLDAWASGEFCVEGVVPPLSRW